MVSKTLAKRMIVIDFTPQEADMLLHILGVGVEGWKKKDPRLIETMPLHDRGFAEMVDHHMKIYEGIAVKIKRAKSIGVKNL